MPAKKKTVAQRSLPAARAARAMNFTALVDSIRQAHAQCAAQANRATVRKPRAPRPARPAPVLTGRFAALDFETADYGRDSACALSVVIVDHGQVVDTWTRLIRPPRQGFVFTYLHGISWRDVHDQPTFGDLWPEAAKRMEGVDFVAAHNASFDRSVLRACCEHAGHKTVAPPFLCTVKLARSAWGIFPTTLADVARHLQIPLKHHDAASDALACAQILLRAREIGHTYEELLQKHALKPAAACRT
jgi:DNA polymerase-3 subunit epsilon